MGGAGKDQATSSGKSVGYLDYVEDFDEAQHSLVNGEASHIKE